MTLVATHVFHNNQNKNNHSPHSSDGQSSSMLCWFSTIKRMVIPFQNYSMLFGRSSGLLIEKGRLSRWGSMLLNRCIGRASLSEHCTGYHTPNKKGRLCVRSVCQENATAKTVAVAPWKNEEREGRIYVVRGLSRPSRGIVYTESWVTCSRRFMKSFVQLMCACVGECTQRLRPTRAYIDTCCTTITSR